MTTMSSWRRPAVRSKISSPPAATVRMMSLSELLFIFTSARSFKATIYVGRRDLQPITKRRSTRSAPSDARGTTDAAGRLKRRGKFQKRARTVVRQRHGKAQRALRGRRHAEILHCRNGHYKRNATSKICLGLESRPKRAASRNLRAERGLKPLSVTLANCEELELPDRRV